MELQRKIAHLQAERASEWLDLLQRGRPEDHAAFQAWCLESPVHIREFLEMTYTAQELMALDADRQIDLDAVLAGIRRDGEPLPRQPWRKRLGFETCAPKGKCRLVQWGLAACALFCALAVGWCGRDWFGGHEYSTAVGELRTIELMDHSVVTLNTDSDIRIEFKADERNVKLGHGEAIFKVARDPNRPFRVHTRAGVIEAIGTQFNVYDRGPEGTDVAVLEGAVRLTPHAFSKSESAIVEELVAGQEARIRLDGAVHRAERADVEGVIAWSKRRLKFNDASLEEIVSEFNRYHQNLRLRLEGIPPGTYHYTGIFDADDPGALALFLEDEGGFSVSRADREIVISRR